MTLLYADVADVTLADVLQQLPLLTVRLHGRHRHACTLLVIAASCCMGCAGDLAHSVVLSRVSTHCNAVLQELDMYRCYTIAAESLAKMPVSLRRLVLRDCYGVPASALTSIKRLSALEDLTLDSLRRAGGDDALQLLALHLPASLTSLGFSSCVHKCKVSAVPSSKANSCLSALICLQSMPCTFS
jgi:hypothetical protein